MCPADDLELRELIGDLVEVWNRAARVARAQRTGVPDLKAKRNAELDALGVDRVVASVVRRESPEPRELPHPDETELLHASAELAHRVHRSVEIDGTDTDEPFGMRGDGLRHLVIRKQRPLRSPPSGRQRLRDARGIERRQRERDGKLVGHYVEPHPPPERREHLVADELPGRVLNPRVDDRLGHEATPLRRARPVVEEVISRWSRPFR